MLFRQYTRVRPWNSGGVGFEWLQEIQWKKLVVKECSNSPHPARHSPLIQLEGRVVKTAPVRRQDAMILCTKHLKRNHDCRLLGL